MNLMDPVSWSDVAVALPMAVFLAFLLVSPFIMVIRTILDPK